MGPTGRERTVLLVEDNPGDARLVAESLRESGGQFRLLSVETLAGAAEVLATESVDAAILDLGLPDSSGIETFLRFEQTAPDVPVIIMSGDADTRTAIQAVQEGAQDFLVKGQADGQLLGRAVAYAIERKKAEAAIAESEERFRYIFDNSMVAKSVTTPNGEINVNDAFCNLLGYTREELSDGTTWMQLTHPDDLELSVRKIDSLLRGEANSAHFEKRFIRKDGGIVWVNVATSLRRDHDGAPLYFMTAILDVTERKLAENELRRSEEELRNAQAMARIGSYSLDMETQLWTSSDTLDDIFGIDESYHRTAENWLALIHEDDREEVARYVQEDVLGRGVPFDTVCRVRRHADGRVVWVHGQGRVDRAADGTPLRLIGAVQDVTAQHEAEEEIIATNESLERMIRDVAELLGSVVEARDPYTQGHQVRVASIAHSLAVEMGLSEDELDCIQMAALLHDIGKLSVPAEILTKPGKLTDVEFALIREHPARGHAILSGITLPWPIADIILQHHERCDGSGYPAGAKCGEILLPARILGIADVLEAMSSYRPYRPALGQGAAITEILENPTKYDPDVTRAALALYERSALGI